MVLDLIKFSEILEEAGKLLDFDSAMPLIGIKIVILIGILTLRLFLPLINSPRVL